MKTLAEKIEKVIGNANAGIRIKTVNGPFQIEETFTVKDSEDKELSKLVRDINSGYYDSKDFSVRVNIPEPIITVIHRKKENEG